MANIFERVEKATQDVSNSVKRVLQVFDETEREINERIADRMEDGAKIALKRQAKPAAFTAGAAVLTLAGIILAVRLLRSK